VAGRHHARRLVDIEADVAAVDRPRLACVQADAHADLDAGRPLVPRERALPLRGRRHGLAGRLERNEKSVALALEHVPAVPLERVAQELAVPGEQLSVAVPRPPGQAR
jgi:hypothetical protein